jgi:hypothetical protein
MIQEEHIEQIVHKFLSLKELSELDANGKKGKSFPILVQSMLLLLKKRAKSLKTATINNN